jgi:hypothetical protein
MRLIKWTDQTLIKVNTYQKELTIYTLSVYYLTRVLELVDRTSLSFVDFIHKRSNRFSGTKLKYKQL